MLFATMNRFSLTVLLAFVLVGCSNNGITEDEVLSFGKTLQGKSSDEIRTAIADRFGSPTRVVGFGLRIEQWEIADGILTFHPMQGPYFTKNKVITRLLKTNNPLADCLFGQFEMTTLPDPSNRGTCFWIGNLALASDGKYQFEDSGQNRKYRSGQEDNFFFNYPTGMATVEYAPGIDGQTRLEDVADGTRVATIEFHSDEGIAVERYDIVTSRSSMRLDFSRDEEIGFQMYKGFVNYWR